MKDYEAEFKKVSIGAEAASIGVHIKRHQLDIVEADGTFTNSQLNATFETEAGGKQPGQGELIEGATKITLTAVATSKGLNVKTDDFSATLSMPVNDIDIPTLARLANRGGTITLERTGDAPEARRGRPPKAEGEAE